MRSCCRSVCFLLLMDSKLPPRVGRAWRLIRREVHFGPLRGSSSSGGYGCPNPEVPRDLYSLPVYPPLCLLLSADPFHPSTASEGALHEKLSPLCLLLASHG
ncbi:hypothetical protein AVEN_73093-1 [Araneus ventricosus]|uniref:Uncharacterized protein n=1 Tax=Araneus ventricosus TaxID=182803 RepID=A0A4Y2J1P7_ARAVE|nr:hypothetical protein AVEN_73093-1 [Araneus ventricosus]